MPARIRRRRVRLGCGRRRAFVFLVDIAGRLHRALPGKELDHIFGVDLLVVGLLGASLLAHERVGTPEPLSSTGVLFLPRTWSTSRRWSTITTRWGHAGTDHGYLPR